MKTDVLDDFDEIKASNADEIGSKVITTVPYDIISPKYQKTK
jgi:hypothetical protein